MINIARVKKRKQSTFAYVDALRENYSKLNVIRVDLSYKKPYSNDVTLQQMNQDIDHMMNNRRSKPAIFKDNVGYIIKREYTKDKGMHIHAFFMFDGQHVKKSAHKADEIGAYWNETITNNKGTYENCNRNGYRKNGIGMINHTDDLKIKYLKEKAVDYICKDTQRIEALSDAKTDKALTRGTLPKKKSNKGRPRKEKTD